MKRYAKVLMLTAVMIAPLFASGCVVAPAYPGPCLLWHAWVPGHWGGYYGNGWVPGHWR